MRTLHAAVRAQQRCIPPLVESWLLDFGEAEFDGRGGVIRYFSKASRRALVRQVGARPVCRLAEYLNCYLVESSDDGRVLTVGRRYERVRRR